MLLFMYLASQYEALDIELTVNDCTESECECRGDVILGHRFSSARELYIYLTRPEKRHRVLLATSTATCYDQWRSDEMCMSPPRTTGSRLPAQTGTEKSLHTQELMALRTTLIIRLLISHAFSPDRFPILIYCY